jgi:hypothetical protein
MKLKLFLAVSFIINLLTACNNSSRSPKAFCDTACLRDTIKFALEHPYKPHVYITASDCIADTVVWSHSGMVNNLKMDFNEVAATGLRLNKNYIGCYFNDTSYAWLEFNDCLTGRGYLVKLNFNRKAGRLKYSSALTRFDPKFKIEDGLICYADYSFVYVEDVKTGKIAKLLLADHELKIDYNNIHAVFDSANITRNRIFVKLIENGSERPLEKNISL